MVNAVWVVSHVNDHRRTAESSYVESTIMSVAAAVHLSDDSQRKRQYGHHRQNLD